VKRNWETERKFENADSSGSLVFCVFLEVFVRILLDNRQAAKKVASLREDGFLYVM